MANTIIQVKKSGSPGVTPSSLSYGELALNYADGILYYKNAGGAIYPLVSPGSASVSFTTMNVNSNLIVATSNTDILNFTASNGITLFANTLSKSIDIDGGTIFNDVNVSYTQANAAYSLAQNAYDAANNASASATLSLNTDNSSNTTKYITFANNASGSTTSLETDANNLVFYPDVGLLGVNAISITPNTTISTKTQSLTSTSETLFDSIDAILYRSAFYEIQVESGPDFHMFNLNIGQNGSNALFNIFGETYSANLITVSANVYSNLLNVYFTPAASSTVVTATRKLFAKQTSVPAGDFGFLTDATTLSFDAGYVSQPSSSSYDYGYV